MIAVKIEGFNFDLFRSKFDLGGLDLILKVKGYSVKVAHLIKELDKKRIMSIFIMIMEL